MVSDKMMNEENLGNQVKLCLNLVYINFVTFMKRIGKMKGVSKHGNEHSTFWAHFSTMGRIKLREIKVSSTV
jgi:uncharacterized protein YqhQ